MDVTIAVLPTAFASIEFEGEHNAHFHTAHAHTNKSSPSMLDASIQQGLDIFRVSEVPLVFPRYGFVDV